MNNIIKPISPQQLRSHKPLPGFVIHAINCLLEERFEKLEPTERTVVLQRYEVIEAIKHSANLINGYSSFVSFDPTWLELKRDYEQAGWLVTYHDLGPCYTFEEKT